MTTRSKSLNLLASPWGILGSPDRHGGSKVPPRQRVMPVLIDEPCAGLTDATFFNGPNGQLELVDKQIMVGGLIRDTVGLLNEG